MISRRASYAIRALTFMVKANPDAWWLNRQIADALALPPQFLTKILRTLAEERILASQRGKSGGFRLARPAREITLFQIVDPFDHLRGKRECLLGQETCSEEASCPLHAEWKTVTERLANVLCTRTLADLSNGSPASLTSRYPWGSGREGR